MSWVDVSVDDTLVVQVYETLQHLCNINSNKRFGELAKLLAYVVEGTVLAEPIHTTT